MKYACIVIEGAADRPIESLGGRTPLEAAPMPITSALALSGRVGSVVTIPAGRVPGPELAFLSLLGYDPAIHDPGRAGFDAATLGVTLRESDRLLCLGFLSVGPPGADDEGLIRPCHGLSDAEVAALATDLLREWRGHEFCSRWSLAGVVQGRAILLIPDGAPLDLAETTDPAAALGQPPDRIHPRGHSSVVDPLGRILSGSTGYLAGHEVNAARREHGLPPVSHAWLWGLGRRLTLPDFRQKHSVRATLVTDSPAALAISRAAGIAAEPPRSTDLAELGRSAAGAIGGADLVVVYTGATNASPDVESKVVRLARIDRDVVRPLAESLRNTAAHVKPGFEPEWRVLITATHASSSETGEAFAAPVPFALCGAWIRSLVERQLTEVCAAESDLKVDPGKDLLEYFLRAGLVGRRR